VGRSYGRCTARCGGSEGQLFRQLWAQFIPGEVVLADRGFCSFGCLAALQQLGLDAVMRLHQARRISRRRGQRLGKADRLVEWTKPRRRPRLLSAEEFAALPATSSVRHVRFVLTQTPQPSQSALNLAPLGPVPFPSQLAREKLARRDDARALLRQLYRSAVDLLPDQVHKTLTVRLHHLTTPAHDQILAHLCAELNATETVFPGTDLRLIYQLGGSS
jgi:hypothetical protein